MRRALILSLLLISLVGIDRHRWKKALRRFAIFFSRHFLRWCSRCYQTRQGPSIIFAPHPDDETLGCGAMIARKRNEGLPLHVVFITDGSASHPGHPNFRPSKLVEIRHREAREALAILGVESNAIHFLDAPDGMLPKLSLEKRAELVHEIVRLLDHIKPLEIFLPCSPDGSSEHEAAFTFIHEAVRHNGKILDIWQYPVWSWWNPLLLIRHRLRTAACCRLEAEDFQAIKLDALNRYKSQTAPLAPQTEPSLPPELVRVFESDVEFFFRFDFPNLPLTPNTHPPIII